VTASAQEDRQIFITTKLNPAREDAEAEAARSLERLGLDRLDLHIIHRPQGGPTWAWPGMKRAPAVITPR
jgi:diketogulonate reductase-like aldo/keto reductase